MRAAGQRRFTRLSPDKSPRGHQPSRSLSLQPMVELNQRTGRDPRNTSAPIIKRLTQAITLAPSIGSEKKHTFLLRQHAHSHLHLGRGERKKQQTRPGQCVNSAAPEAALQSSPPHSRRETLALRIRARRDRGPPFPLSKTFWSLHIDHSSWHLFKRITVPQTQKQDETSRATRTQEGSLGFPGLFSARTVCPGCF